MRLRLGLLRDAATIERLEAAEKAAKLAAKDKAAASTSTTTASATATPTPISTSTAAPKNASTSSSHTHSSDHHAHQITTFSTGGRTYHIRPLSESKAIDRGAAFISEFFLFAVAGSLILFESLRARRKELNRQDVVTERLERLEERTRQDEIRLQELEEEVWRLKGGKGPRGQVDLVPLWEGQEKVSWWRRVPTWARRSHGGGEEGGAGERHVGVRDQVSTTVAARTTA